MNQTPDDHPHDLISAYADGELDASGRASVERHLRTCAGCRRVLDDLRTLASATAAEEPPPIPLDLAARIRLRLPAAAKTARHPAGRPWWWSPLPLSAAAAILVGGALFLVMSRELRAPREEPLVARVESSPPAIPVAPPAAIAEQAPAGDALSTDAGSRQRSPRSAPASTLAPAPAPAFAPALAPAPASQGVRGVDRPGQDVATEKPEAARERDSGRTADKSVAARADSAAGASIDDADLSPGFADSRRAAAGAGGRRLLLTTPLYEVELLETGSLTLRAPGYTCVQDLGWLGSPEEAPAGALPEERPPDPMAPRHLFGLASSADFMSAPDAPAARTGTPGSAPRAGASRLALMSGDRKMLHAVAFEGPEDRQAAPVVREIAQRIDQLVRQRLRPGLEQECGPLPPGIR